MAGIFSLPSGVFSNSNYIGKKLNSPRNRSKTKIIIVFLTSKNRVFPFAERYFFRGKARQRWIETRCLARGKARHGLMDFKKITRLSDFPS